MRNNRVYLVCEKPGLWKAKQALTGLVIAEGTDRTQVASLATLRGYWFAY